MGRKHSSSNAKIWSVAAAAPLIGIEHGENGIAREPFRCPCPNMDPKVGFQRFQRANNLIRTHCMAVAVTGRVVKN